MTSPAVCIARRGACQEPEWVRQAIPAGKLWAACMYSLKASVLQEELSYNPFLRCGEPALAEFTGAQDPVTVLGITRQRKDKG